MKVTKEKFNECLAQFVQGVLIPNAKSKMTKFALGFALGTGRVALTGEMEGALKAVGVIGEDGAIDIDALKAATYKGIEMSGGIPIPSTGIEIERDDIDKFFRLVETGAVG